MSASIAERSCCLLLSCAMACGDAESDADDGGGDAAAGAGASGAGSAGGGTLPPSTGGSAGSGMGGAGGLNASGASAGGSNAVGGSVEWRGTRIASYGAGLCALNDSGNILCWGNPPTTPDWAIPAGVFVDIAAWLSVCAIDRQGLVSCFSPPELAGGLDGVPTGPVKQVAVAHPTFCSLDLQNRATCSHNGVPTPDEEFSQVSAGAYFACGIRESDQHVMCWGKAGDESLCEPNVPEAGQIDPPSGAFKQVATRQFQSCGIRTDGTLACWGAGKADDSVQPNACGNRHHYGQSAPPAGTFSHVAVGSSHACAVRTDSTVACWGAGTTVGDCQADVDQCGQASPPIEDGFVQVTAGYSNSCGMKRDGKVRCWGSNTFGRSTPPLALQ